MSKWLSPSCLVERAHQEVLLLRKLLSLYLLHSPDVQLLLLDQLGHKLSAVVSSWLW